MHRFPMHDTSYAFIRQKRGDVITGSCIKAVYKHESPGRQDLTVGFWFCALSHISIVSGLGHIFVFNWFCLLGFVRLRSPDIEGVPLPRDVKDSFNVSTFFRFSGRIFYACLLVKVY